MKKTQPNFLIAAHLLLRLSRCLNEKDKKINELFQINENADIDELIFTCLSEFVNTSYSYEQLPLLKALIAALYEHEELVTEEKSPFNQHGMINMPDFDLPF